MFPADAITACPPDTMGLNVLSSLGAASTTVPYGGQWRLKIQLFMFLIVVISHNYFASSVAGMASVFSVQSSLCGCILARSVRPPVGDSLDQR